MRTNRQLDSEYTVTLCQIMLITTFLSVALVLGAVTGRQSPGTAATAVAKPNALPPPRFRGAHTDAVISRKDEEVSYPTGPIPSKPPEGLAAFLSDAGACGAAGVLGSPVSSGNQTWVDPHTSAAFAEMLNRVARGLQVSPAFTPLITSPTAPATGKFWCTNNAIPQSCALVCNDGFYPNQETQLSLVAKNCIGPCGCISTCTRLAPTAAVGNPPLTCTRFVPSYIARGSHFTDVPVLAAMAGASLAQSFARPSAWVQPR